MQPGKIILFICLLSISSVRANVDHIQCSNSHMVEGVDYMVRVQWSLSGNIVSFNMTVGYVDVFSGEPPPSGFWIGLGFSNKTVAPFMYPADVIIGKFPTLEPGDISDRYTTAASTPLLDSISNIVDLSTFKDGSIVSMSFKRSILTSDQIHDVTLNEARYWTWAVGSLGQGGSTLMQHNVNNRGTVLPSPMSLPSPNDCSGMVQPSSSVQVVPESTKLVFSSAIMMQPSPTPVFDPTCESDSTSSDLYGSYTWPQTDTSQVAVLSCVYGAPFGNGPANATRICSSEAIWTDPDYSACRDTLPEVVISPAEELTVEVGRRITISCSATGVNEEISSTWFKLNRNGELELVERLTTFNNNNLQEFSLAPNKSVQSFKDNLFFVFIPFHNIDQESFSFLDVLISWEIVIGEVGFYTISPSEAISGTYICRGEQETGNRDANVTINVQVPSADAAFSKTYIRQTANFDGIVRYTDPELQLAIIESKFLEAIPAERDGLQTVTCKDVTQSSSGEDVEEEVSTKRLECLIKEFPPQQSTALLGDDVLSIYLGQSVQGSSNTSETGFCDPDYTIDESYGNYTWPETVGGQTISFDCPTNNNFVKRTCLGSELGWNTMIDFTDCREIDQLPVLFQFYLRFSSNFNSSLQPDIVIDNIRISIELSSDSIFADCTFVSLTILDSKQRVECNINGTSETESGAKVAEEIVINDLIALGLLVPNSNTTSVEGYCNSESTNGQEGTITWPEATIGTTVRKPCPFGGLTETPMASRMCVSRLQWSTPMTVMCSTVVSQDLKALGNSLDEITVNSVAEFTRNLTSLVVSATANSMADQTEENVLIVSQSLSRALELVQSPNVSLSTRISVTTDIVTILDDVEEWPMGNIREESPNIIMTFENVVGNLVLQENFTDLTVSTEDVTLLAKRVDSNNLEQNGRTFTVKQVNGVLQVNSSFDQSSQNLQEDQSAILSFPSGVNIQELVGKEKEDVGIFFVVYDKDVWFPVTVTEQRPQQDPVGSAVVAFTIAGLPADTILPEPVSINLRIVDPATGSSENISDAKCVFYNFEMLMWDPTGCETIYDPDVDPSIATCRCTHLTNFAALVDISARVGDTPVLSEEQIISLNAITYIGVVLSLLGLLMTFITLIIFKKIRQRDVTKFHLQLCVALACMYLVFVSGIGSTDNRGGCITVGTMIQYFTLVAWMWMGAEALLMFQKLIIVFGTKTWKYLLLVSIVCWSVPIVPVVIPVAIDPDYYITTYDDNTTRAGFCFISDIGVFFGAFLGPIFLVIIFNTVVYILVIRVLVKHNLDKKKYKMEKSSMTATEALKLLLSISGILVLFGLSWIFAVFTFVTNGDASFAFQFIFAFFNAFQGFWIFFFFVLLNTEARESWKQLVFKVFRIKASSSGKMNLSSKNTYSVVSSSRATEHSTVINNEYSVAPVKYSAKTEDSPDAHAFMLNEKEKEVRELEKESAVQEKLV